MLDESSGTIAGESFFCGTCLKRKLAPGLNEVCNGCMAIPRFQWNGVDPSSAFWAPPATNAISMPERAEVKLGLTQVISDSDNPVERLNSKSTLGCSSSARSFELAGFFGLGTFSFPRCNAKSNSKSIEDSSSVSLAEDIVVQAVAELPLLSEELVERPSPRDSEESTCSVKDPPIELHFRLIP